MVAHTDRLCSVVMSVRLFDSHGVGCSTECGAVAAAHAGRGASTANRSADD